jgi:hypothetical protein
MVLQLKSILFYDTKVSLLSDILEDTHFDFDKVTVYLNRSKAENVKQASIFIQVNRFVDYLNGSNISVI